MIALLYQWMEWITIKYEIDMLVSWNRNFVVNDSKESVRDKIIRDFKILPATDDDCVVSEGPLHHKQ